MRTIFLKKGKNLSIHLLQPLPPVSRRAIAVGVVVLIVLGRGIVLHQAEAAPVALVRERLVQPAKGRIQILDQYLYLFHLSNRVFQIIFVCCGKIEIVH